MPQLSLTESAAVPTEIRLTLRDDPRDPGASSTTLIVCNAAGEVVGSSGGKWVGGMTVYLPSWGKAIIEAYLWGEGAVDVLRASQRVRNEARLDENRRCKVVPLR